MTASDDPKALGPCPTDEELAAFLDGMLPEAERARITAHLADCESCFDIFASAVHFQQEAAGMEGGDRKVLPFAPKKQGLVRPLWWGSIAAAAVLAVGVAGYRWYFGEPTASVADLMADLAGRPGLGDRLDLHVSRGPQDNAGLLPGPPEFMLGDRLVELQVCLVELGQAGNAANLLREMSGYFKQIPFGQDDSELSLKDAAALEQDGSPQTRRRIAAAWQAKEAELDEHLLPTFAFGKWAEAGRLAAATRTPAFFADWRNRRFLRALLKDRSALDKEIVPYLETIRATWSRGRLQEQDYRAMSESFEQIINAYRIQASSSDFLSRD